MSKVKPYPYLEDDVDVKNFVQNAVNHRLKDDGGYLLRNVEKEGEFPNEFIVETFAPGTARYRVMVEPIPNKKHNTMLDVAFVLEHDEEDWENVSREAVISALERRVQYLRNNPDEIGEAIGFSDTYENNQPKKRANHVTEKETDGDSEDGAPPS
jgi:hypothetical protein